MMKKTVLLALAAFVLAGTAFAKEDNGALGGGVVWENQSGSSYNPKYSGYFDIGWQFVGPIFVGFEFQGTYKEQSSKSATETQTLINSYYVSQDAYNYYIATYYSQQSKTTQVTFYETDVSPRAYASIDLGDGFQALAFLGASKLINNFNVLVTDDNSGDTLRDDTQTVSETPWSVVGGIRGSFNMIYVDYTRYLNVLKGGKLDWNAYSADKLSAGITLRW